MPLRYGTDTGNSRRNYHIIMIRKTSFANQRLSSSVNFYFIHCHRLFRDSSIIYNNYQVLAVSIASCNVWGLLSANQFVEENRTKNVVQVARFFLLLSSQIDDKPCRRCTSSQQIKQFLFFRIDKTENFLLLLQNSSKWRKTIVTW